MITNEEKRRLIVPYLKACLKRDPTEEEVTKELLRMSAIKRIINIDDKRDYEQLYPSFSGADLDGEEGDNGEEF